MHEDVIKGGVLTCEYDSLAEFADAAARRRAGHFDCDDHWAGASFTDALTMARHGWTEKLDEALALAEDAITMADQEHMMDTFAPIWDVAGAEVDVARYLSGEPENMIDYPLSKTSKQGRVITLVASIGVSSAITTETIMRRGKLIVALALALTRLGHSVELWADTHFGISLPEVEMKVKVKGVDDEIDAAQIMFAYAHPAMSRRLEFGVIEGLKGRWRRKTQRIGVPMPTRPSSYPEGAIILPELRSDRDVPNADEFLRKYLGELGLLAE